MKKILFISCFAYLSLFANCPDLTKLSEPTDQDRQYFLNLKKNKPAVAVIYIESIKQYNSKVGFIKEEVFEEFSHTKLFEDLLKETSSNKSKDFNKFLKESRTEKFNNLLLNINSSNSNWCY